MGGIFRRLNLSETATHVTGRYVSQQCQMRTGSFQTQPCARNLFRRKKRVRIWIRGLKFLKILRKCFLFKILTTLIICNLVSTRCSSCFVIFYQNLFSKFNRFEQGWFKDVGLDIGWAASCIRKGGHLNYQLSGNTILIFQNVCLEKVLKSLKNYRCDILMFWLNCFRLQPIISLHISSIHLTPQLV